MDEVTWTKNKESVKKRDGMLVDINIEHLLKILVLKNQKRC